MPFKSGVGDVGGGGGTEVSDFDLWLLKEASSTTTGTSGSSGNSAYNSSKNVTAQVEKSAGKVGAIIAFASPELLILLSGEL